MTESESLKSYSPFIKTVSDQQANYVGTFGNSVHYSVLSCIDRLDPGEASIRYISERIRGHTVTKYKMYHNFLVIWDADHDERLMVVVNFLHLTNLLTNVRAIGERRGVVSVLLKEDCKEQEEVFDACLVVCESLIPGDTWEVDISGELNIDCAISFIESEQDDLSLKFLEVALGTWHI